MRDTGAGIPPEEMPKLFERFHRVESTRGRTHEGSGIGLALVQELVRLHGGEATAESVLGQGTTFTIRLPLGTAHLPADRLGEDTENSAIAAVAAPFVEEALRWLPESAPAGPSPEASSESDTRARILVADDNADMRAYVSRLLAEHYRVEVAPDGKAALESAVRSPPDLILTDVMMPRLDGVGLLKKIRANPRIAGNAGDPSLRPGRRGEPGGRPRDRRRRLSHQAVQRPGAAGPHQLASADGDRCAATPPTRCSEARPASAPSRTRRPRCSG